MMKISKTVRAFIILVIVCTLLSGCGGSEKGGKQADTKKDTLTVALSANPATLFPKATNIYALEAMTNIYDSLLFLDGDLSLKPMLAESWEYLSGNELQFKLRKDVVFHNGEKMTADDVVYSFEYFMNEPTLASSRPEQLTKIEKIDDYTVKFTFASANYNAVYKFASQNLAILNKKITAGKETEAALNPIGTGPYKFVKKENDIIYLERHDEYYGEKAKIKNLILKAMPDNEARLIAVETGEVDIGVRIAQSGFDNAAKNEKLNAVSVDVGTIYGIALNSNAKALQDVRVRQAISYAIDNTSISAIATEGRFKVSDTVLPADLDKDINVKLHSFDIAKAKDLLKEAGYADGLKLTATIYQIDFGVKGITVIQSQLKVIGIDLSIETLETAAWSSKLMKKDYEMSIIAFNSPDSTTDGILYGKFNNKTGVLGYKNEKVTELLNNARIENDKQKQNGLYKQALEIISDDALCVPWFEVSLNYVYSKSLKGLVINNRGYGGLNRYNTVYWE